MNSLPNPLLDIPVTVPSEVWYTITIALIAFMGVAIWKIMVFVMEKVANTFEKILNELKILNNSDIRQNMLLDNHEERLDAIEGQKIVKYKKA